MGIAYRINKDLRCTVVVWDGRVTRDDHIDHLVRLAADTNWPPGRRHLTDLTTATDISVAEPALIDALVEGTDFRDNPETALIVRPEFLNETRITDTSSSLGGMPKAFADLDSACAYLNVNAQTVRAMIDELRQELGQ